MPLFVKSPRVKGFTLIELLVVIAIISVITAILVPMFATAREKARSAACLTNLRQIAMGIFLYSQDYDERCPMLLTGITVTPGSRTPGWYGDPTLSSDEYWTDLVAPYIENQRGNDFSTASKVFMCPSDAQGVSQRTQRPVASYGLSDNWADWYCPADCNNGTGQAHSFNEAISPSSTILLAETMTDSTSTNPTHAHALSPIAR